ncbi:hypothetical protein E4T56_gene6919 [Termitomyces sp. T112]|nr:hypothetical protein E4T56_gene6919 [Termitomyces sp. T112]
MPLSYLLPPPTTTLEPLCFATDALLITSPSLPPPAPTLEVSPWASMPAYPGLMQTWQKPHPKGLGEGDTHARSLHAPRPPPSPATPPTASQPWPLPESSPPPPSPTASPPPLWNVPPTVPDISTNSAPPIPLPWSSALLYHNLATTHSSPSAPCHGPPPLTRALLLMLPIFSTTPPPGDKEMFW